MLEAWPSDARRSRLVLITQDLPREPVEEMLRAFLETGPSARIDPENP